MMHARDILGKVVKSFAPPPDITVSEWADENRFLSQESSARPGRFKTSSTEYMREPMDMVGKSGVRRVTLMTSAQVGKSTVIENIIGYHMHHDPCPILHVSPTLDSMKMFSKERLAPMIRDCPSLSGIVKDARSRDSNNTLASKALALDTPIPTPDGWTTMGELKDGDTVFAVDGSPCNVVSVSPIFENHDCYDVTFSDGTVVTADAGHLWEVYEWKVDKTGDRPRQVRKVSVRETTEIAENYRKCGRYRYSVSPASPLDTPNVDLPIDPYVMGIWLGDGFSHTNLFCAGVADADEIVGHMCCSVFERKGGRGVRLFRFGDVTHSVRDSETGRMSSAGTGVFDKMRRLGLLSEKGSGCSNKHIPSVYLRAGTEQRMELLRGLMDSDGYSLVNGTCGFSTSLPRLADGFSELLASLGLRSSYSARKTVFDGKRHKNALTFSFPSPEFTVFKLQRKISSQMGNRSCRGHGGRRIVRVERVSSVPTRCILVDHPRHLFLAGKGMVPTHNTFPGGHIAMVGSNAPAGLASRPIRTLVCDEVDRFEVSAGTEGDPINLAIKRTTTFWNSVLVFVSTPGNKGQSRIEDEYLNGDQRKWWCPCPHCDEMQTLEWRNVVSASGQPFSSGDASSADDASYMCDHCGSLWNDAERRRAIRKGEWRASRPFNGNVSYHLSQLYSPFAPLADGVRDFLDAKGNPEKMKTWVNTFLGETWEEKGQRLSWSDVMDHREDYETRDPIPEDVTLITFGADTQDDRVEIEWVGWGNDMQSWSLGYEVIMGDPSTPEFWVNVKSALSQTFVHPLFGEMTHSYGMIDSGGHYTDTVYKFAPTIPRTVAIKGVSGWDKPIVSYAKNTKSAHQVVNIGVDVVKEIVASRLRQHDPDVAGYCRFPMTYGDKYFTGITAEELRTKYHKGFQKREWHKVSNNARNEPFDIRVYATAALDMLGIDINAHRRWRLNELNTRGTSEKKAPKKRTSGTNFGTSWKND